MTVSILRTADAWWVQTASGARAHRYRRDHHTELLADRSAIDAAANSTDTVPVESLALLSPITTPCRVVAQATNFASHVKDVGRDPAKTPLTFFRKASGSVTGPFGDIVKPVACAAAGLRAGDRSGDRPRAARGHRGHRGQPGRFRGRAGGHQRHLGARCAADQAQFFESKSYPTFTPVGPALVLVDADELKRFGDLRLQLRVNGEVRQDMVVEGDILYPPVQALQALSKFQKLDAGDILLTGTPVGTALTTHGVAPKGDIDILAFLSAQAERTPTTCKTATWWRPPWPPTTAPSTSASTQQGGVRMNAQSNERPRCRSSCRWSSSVPARPASPPRRCWAVRHRVPGAGPP